ncbi:MAG: hypothetical protein QW597_05610 [Thermoplasmataceae archaeon]
MQIENESSSLWNRILDHLLLESKSISGIAQELSKEGIKLNRLFLTGYLEAMVRVGVLAVREIKPSKVYSVNQEKQFDIYEKVGKLCREKDPENAADRVLDTLNLLFNRPIFLREIERCNVDIPNQYKKANSAKRAEYIEKLTKLGLKIPENNAMLEPTVHDKNFAISMLIQLIKSNTNLDTYSPEESEGIQKRLDE